ncbi:MAG: FAD-binding oxidoreductase [Phycisphaerales bacterium]|nr:FAD-binding oxidoreductase [Phycisphaerales bacterium]
MADSCDVVIVGGGVMGLSLALHLAALGVNDVVLIEKRFCGAGSSGKSGAICRQHYSNEVTAALARDSLAWYAALEHDLFRTTGCLFFADAALGGTMALNVRLLQSLGIRTEMIDVRRAREIEPRLLLDDAPAICWEPDAGYCDAPGVIAHLAGLVRAAGVDIRLGHRVATLERSAGAVRGVRLEDGATLRAEVVVNAANAWAAPLARTVDIDLPIRATRPEIAFSLRPRVDHRQSPTHPVMADLTNAFYARPDLPGQTLMGGLDIECDPEVPDPDREPEGIADETVCELNRRIARRIPEMQRSRSRGGMGALYACTPDHHALIGEEPSCRGLFTCAGFSGHGFKLAPEIGRELAHRITRGTWDRHDLSIYRPTRFAEDQPVQGRYDYSILG